MELSPGARQQVEEKARLEGPQPRQESAKPMKPQLQRLVRPLLVVFGLVFVVTFSLPRNPLESKQRTRTQSSNMTSVPAFRQAVLNEVFTSLGAYKRTCVYE